MQYLNPVAMISHDGREGLSVLFISSCKFVEVVVQSELVFYDVLPLNSSLVSISFHFVLNYSQLYTAFLSIA